ncbi:ComEC/Rec2 family competence protein [Sphingomonas sp. 36D10-4-7]|jgi:competence protein ComEC|uniref:ComEC/Rec2 family competence protein n=2 Tax=Sphingomonas corticis TaxID=2722791 RepID=A0ABX1CN90_9SPHN|nr:ComEC/Rec2 family competence protein [Sphingomonas corticis]
MASSAAPAPSKAIRPLQIAVGRWRDAAERRLEAERDQLFLFLPVMLGGGIAAWLLLPDPRHWAAAMLAAGAVGCAALAGGGGGRLGRAVAVGAAVLALGVALIWWRADRVAAPVLARAAIVAVEGQATAVEPLPARALVRVTLVALRWQAPVPDPAPRRIRVNLAAADVPAGLSPGATIRLRARLMPPAPPAVPGAYDFARVAWFQKWGATGRGFAPVAVIRPGEVRADARARLTRHIESRLDGSAGGIAAALATGSTGAIGEPDAEAMRRAGLAHLLSVSGLHITAVVALVMLVVSRLLALSVRVALTGRVPLLAGSAAALAAIGYTWLAGAEVPTIRSCVAALMILAAIALGREAITMRLVAVGALIVLAAWPEALAGPSFQLSFAAVTAIVALHEHAPLRAFLSPRGERWPRRLGRGFVSLLVTGLVVEAALMPIAAFHFHRAGLYGALANLVAIPLTTFVVMPAEAAALALDAVGLGAPLWWVAGQGIALLLAIARHVAAAPGAVAAVPAMPAGAFALMVSGGLWFALWRTRWRRWGALPFAIGAAWALATPPPDLIVTGDGRHLGLRTDDGRVAMLRDRGGDYVRDTLGEAGGARVEGDDAAPTLLSDLPAARCNRDLCRIARGGREVLATRSAFLVPAARLVPLCRRADVVVSERRLPRRCRARWLTLDRATLERTGGVAVTFATGRIVTVRRARDRHPWVVAVDDAAMKGRPARYRMQAWWPMR